MVMGCKAAMHSWSLCGLVGAFLDLAITYFLLCVSALAFFLSFFLAFFGLALPCTCKCTSRSHLGPHRSCLQQRLLVDCPNHRLSRVQSSIRNNFPFRSVFHQLDSKCFDENNQQHLRIEENMSRSDHLEPVLENEAPIDDVKDKGKGVATTTTTQRQRVSLRRRRRGNHLPLPHDAFASSSSFDHVHSDAHGSPSTVSRMIHDISAYSSMPASSYDGHPPSTVMERGSPPHVFGSNDITDANDSTDNNSLSSEDQRINVRSGLEFEGEPGNSIIVLKQALEEAQAARASLWSELEKERIAAATAADEAMAMILRLQQEKASIEMDARQYQRIIEEKSTYDEEEMGILKEIIVRREREKHFLEKQVEAFRNLVLGTEQLEGDPYSKIDSQLHMIDELSDDPIQMLQQLSDAVEKARKGGSDDALQTSVSLEKDSTAALGGDVSSVVLTELDDKFVDGQDLVHASNELSQEIQEKGMISMNKLPISQQDNLQKPEASSNVHSSVDHPFKNQNSIVLTRVEDQTYNGNSSTNIVPCKDGKNDGGEDRLLDANGMEIKIENNINIYDVHVIDGEFNAHDPKQSSTASVPMHHRTSNVTGECEMPSESSNAAAVGDSSSSSDIVDDGETSIIRNSLVGLHKLLPPLNIPHPTAPHSELQRHSISAVDLERLRLSKEVDWLQEKLRTVQEERGKLSVSSEYRESNNTELQLLEGILKQLQEIRQLREPRNTLRQASLPPPSSKVVLKKKRSRSVSVDVYKSS
ncbi:Myosin-binding protein 3-like protein [Drosera capensis]